MLAGEAGQFWDGPGLLHLLSEAAQRLEQEAPAINALNVFPVPDGDTGTNMVLTLRAALAAGRRELDGPSAAGAAQVAQTIAQGALMGARGNAGVILSQLLRGFAQGLGGCDLVDGPALVQALGTAAVGAYRGVARPVEGTMLTVIREAAEAVAALNGCPTLEEVLAAAVAAARASLSRTPDLLPVLREAGVVDAGGQGIVALLEGALLSVRGQDVARPDAHLQAQAIDPRWLEQAHQRLEQAEPEYGYCTEFVLRGAGLPLDELRAAMAALGGSVLVVGDEGLAHVHVHTFDPGAALSYATVRGSLLQVKVDNMQEQYQAFVAGHAARQAQAAPPLPRAPGAAARVGVVAVAPGPGLAQVFRSLGAEVVPGGQTMNPSAADLLDGVARCEAEQVVLLPNNPNIVGTARQAAVLSERRIAVVPSRTVPQGIAALLALQPDADLDEAERAMTAALGQVRTIEVTRAVRAVTLQGVAVQAGQTIALLDDRLVATGDTAEAAVLAALEQVTDFTPTLLTVYYGDQVGEAEARTLTAALQAAVPGTEGEVIAGGQPHYPYIVAVE